MHEGFDQGDEFRIKDRIKLDQFRAQGLDFIEASPASDDAKASHGRELKFHQADQQLKAVDIERVSEATHELVSLSQTAHPAPEDAALLEALTRSTWNQD